MEVRRLSVPGPLGKGAVNCYLLPGDPVTLVDTGPASGFAELRDAVRAEGMEVTDIEQILITHPHSDHFGAAHRLEAEVAAHPDAADIVEDYPAHREASEEFFSDYFVRNGMPEDVASGLIRANLPDPDCSVTVDRRVKDGDALAVPGGEIEVVEAPGHARGNLVFAADDRAFTGDTVLAKITPNPTLQLPEEGERPPASLVRYLDTLRELVDRDPGEGHGGHGPHITDVADRAGEIIAHHAERKERILEMLDRPRTAYDLMMSLFEGLPRDEYYFGMSEIIGHLRLLEEEARVERRSGDLLRYARQDS